jgi:signal transduction histidine kinase/DNA-binding response OmpR family regulator
MEKDALVKLIQSLTAQLEQQQAQIVELEKKDKKNKREIIHLQKAIEQEKTVANAKANQQVARTLAQRERDKYLKLLLGSSPNIILLLDRSGRVAYCTDAFLKTARLPGHVKVSGRPFEEVFCGFVEQKWVDEIAGILKKAIDSNTTLKFSSDIDFSQEGELRKYVIHFTPMANENGEHEGTMLLFHDVTDIESARDAAERASAAKSTFLSNMSHEMRTPMNAIIGMTSIGQAASDVEKKDYAFGKIANASAHLLGVINDILDMNKIEANKFELSPEAFNFEKMLQKVVNVIHFRVDEKRQDFIVHIDSDIPHILIGDDQRLAQVLTNLLSNAVKFTPESGSVRLNTHLLKEENGVCLIQIEVTDTGIGISEEQQSRLFTSFEQAENSTSRKYGGTGLGLAISKRIVEMMGGRIWIKSEPGKGSSFIFTIQAERGAEEQRGLLKPSANWKNIHVLAVDDAPEIRDYFVEIARGLDVTCHVAASGEEACSFIERNGACDIYFVDWKMPGMDGIELSRRIKRYDEGKSVVIMISSVEWNMIEEEAKNAGVDRFLQKPLFPSAIVGCISDCLGVDNLIAAEKAQPDETDNFGGCRVLLAEDVEINREIVLSLLAPTLLTIDCVENGAEALRMFSAAPDRYDMIFMDVQMPEMDGYEATRRIRALDAPRAKEIPIVAMTANVFREDIEKCLEAGMNDHIGKPLDFDEMFVRLRKYLRIEYGGTDWTVEAAKLDTPRR